ncbi:MAG: lysine decarboxylase [Chitinivibrionales bacterium]|nr:lysine decarboxylase [Chitinivibrionales bacterium]
MTTDRSANIGEWPLKAYKNIDFLTSPDARIIRVLAEFVEPQGRLRREHVHHTIVFFGSAKAPSPEMQRTDGWALRLGKYYDATVELARKVSEWSETISDPGKRFFVCSGGGPGIMEAANRGAKEANAMSVGLNISLPQEQIPNPHQTRELSFDFHYFFIRKFWFFYLAKALVVFPGGVGTMDELFELLTLVQTKKTAKYMPIVLFGSEFWNEVLDFDAMVKWGVISPEDLNLFRVFDDVDDAFVYLRDELTRRYVSKGA